MKTSREKAVFKHKHGIELWVYPEINSIAELVYIDMKGGQHKEFLKYDKHIHLLCH